MATEISPIFYLWELFTIAKNGFDKLVRENFNDIFKTINLPLFRI